MIKDLIEIKQLPVIEEQLKTVSKTIDDRIKNAKSLACTEESIKTVKELRASLNKDFQEFEAKKKEVKEKILAPYNRFEEVYKEYISDKFKNADKDLKEKIDTVENELKNKKEQEIRDYFEEYKQANNIDFVTFEQAKINITLSASMKSLKEQAKAFIDKIADDLVLISTQINKEEILIEYKKDLNVSRSITEIMNKKEQLRQLEEQKVNEKLEAEKKVIEDNLSNLGKPTIEVTLQSPIEEEEKFTMTFKVKNETKSRLKLIKEFLNNGGYDYE